MCSLGEGWLLHCSFYGPSQLMGSGQHISECCGRFTRVKCGCRQLWSPLALPVSIGCHFVGWPHAYQSSFLGLPGAGVKGMCLCAGPHPLMVVRGPKGGTPQEYLGSALVSLDQHLVTGPFPLPRFQSRSFSGECGLCPRAQGQS